MNGLKWSDAEDIAELLDEKHPNIDPLAVRFTDLHRWICELDQFDDDPAGSSEARLEAIQMAWLQRRQDR